MSSIDDMCMAEEQEVLEESCEPIQNHSNLEQEKRNIRNFSAHDNIAHTQIFINALKGNLNAGSVVEQTVSIAQKPSRTYCLHNLSDCVAFVEDCKHSEYLATAIVLSAFETVILGDLPDLVTSLMELLPTDGSTAGDVEAPTPTRDAYLSLNTVLATIGGTRFSSDDNKRCVSLGVHSQQVLQNIWEQFPHLRDPICRWLVELLHVYKYRTAFDAYQIAAAFARVASLDLSDAKKRIFPRLYADSKNTGLIGSILCILYRSESLQPEVQDIMERCLCSESIWLWQPACMAYVFLTPELQAQERMDTLVAQSIRRQLNVPFSRQTRSFLSSLLFQSRSFRTTFIHLLSQHIHKASNRTQRQTEGQAFLYLLRTCYFLVDSKQPALPLVACDNAEQLRSLSPLLEVLMTYSTLRRQLYAVLQAYLNEINYYSCSKQLITHIAAYFYTITQLSPTYEQEVKFFLAQCGNSLAQQISAQIAAHT